ncbi:MAG: TrkH family potassium uptake protein [Aeromonas sp.]
MIKWRQHFAFPLTRREGVLGERRLREGPMVVASFVLILLAGAICLWLPSSHTAPLRFIDALFMATSAISVTGLGVVDTGSLFTLQGQIILLLLIEIGGLGQMTMTLWLLALLGNKVALRQQVLAKEALGQDGSVNVTRLVRVIVLFALSAQAIGTALLALRWVPEFGWGHGLYVSFFHAVSAFNNAGFSLFSQNIIPYQRDALVCLTIAALLIVGGIGFTVVFDSWQQRRFTRLKLHSKVMLVATPLLLLGGSTLFWALERGNSQTLGGFALLDQWLIAFFHAASARTAGFNSLDLGALTPAALLFMMILMFIGAGSTSTGGGIKVTTFAVVLLATRSFLTKRPAVSAFGRAIPPPVVTKALAIIIVSSMVLMLATFGLLLTESLPFDQLLFEAVSAFATVGLTTGITPALSDAGKFILVLVMICGRLGPLSLALLLAQPVQTRLRFVQETIYTG